MKVIGIMVALLIYVGSHHPKVGVILTCIALMYRLKATAERSSSLLIQEVLAYLNCQYLSYIHHLFSWPFH